MRKLAATGTYVDNDVEDGYVLTEPSEYYPDMVDFTMSKATHMALLHSGTMPDVYRALESREPGLHLVPASILRADEAEDLNQGLTLIDPTGTSEYCDYPPCSLPADLVIEGFSLCVEHALLKTDWASA